MKRTVLCTALLAVLAAATPFLCLVPPFAPTAAAVSSAALPTPGPGSTPGAGAMDEAADIGTAAPSPAPTPAPETAALYDEAAGAVLEVPLRDYLIGAAACEMPVTWPDDAIRAQMVACHSYLLYQQAHGGAAKGGSLTVNSAMCSGWTSAEVLQSRWGEDFDTRWARLEGLAAEVEDAVLLYGGAPAAACYHAISTGHTEASQNVWVEALPYLQGVDSSWDKASGEYEVTVQYSSQQVYDALVSVLGTTPDGDPSTWVGDTVWDAAGYVESITLGGQRFSGVQVRAALGLRSACFAIAWADGQFTVTTRGYGHGVGLSQYGAYAMASGGAGWRSILAYYFPGTELNEG